MPPKIFACLFLALVTLAVPAFGQQTQETRTVTFTYPQPTPGPTGGWACTPQPRLDWWFGRFEGNVDKLKAGPYDLVFDGDSITDNWYNDPESRKVWDQNYGSLKALDLGIGGDQVQHIIWRAQHGSLAGQNPKLIVIMAGTNNINQKAEDVAAGIKMLLGEYETRCPDAHILLLGIFPRGAKATDPARDWIASVNKIISTYDSDKRITYMDIGQKFLQPDGSIAYDTMRDSLHPSPAGYVIWAAAIKPVIDQYFPQPAAN